MKTEQLATCGKSKVTHVVPSCLRNMIPLTMADNLLEMEVLGLGHSRLLELMPTMSEVCHANLLLFTKDHG